MRRKIMAFALVCALVIAAMWTEPAVLEASTTSDSVLEMKTSSTSLNKGDAVTVNFYVHDVATSGFGGYLNFDTSVFGSFSVSQISLPLEYSSEAGTGDWDASYSSSSKYLSVQETNGSYISLASSTSGLLMTITFTVIASATSTTISLDYPTVYTSSGSTDYPSGVSLTISNSSATKITLGTESVSGNSLIAVPVKFTTNGGFLTLTLSATYDSSKLSFVSVTAADSIKSKVTIGSYTVSNSGSKVTASITATSELTTTGTLFYMNFKAVDSTATQSDLTTVTLAIDEAANTNETAFSLTGATSTVTITEQDHTLGDVNGNGEINLVDALLVIRYYNGVQTLTTVQLAAADVNGSGTVNLVDAQEILQYYNGVITSF